MLYLVKTTEDGCVDQVWRR